MKNGKIIIFLLAVLMMTVLSLSSCHLLDSFINAPDESPADPPAEVPTEHNLSKVDAVAATCTADGHEEYYTCSGCDLLFADAEGTILLDAPVVIPAKHITEVIPGRDSTCTEDGYTASRICTVCDEVITPSEPIAAGHKTSPKADFWGFTMKNIDGRAYVVVYGGNASNKCATCGEEQPLKVAMDFQHNHNIDGLGWKSVKVYADNNNLSSNADANTVVAPAVNADKLASGLFEACFDVTDFQVGWTLTIHVGLDGNMFDPKDHGSGDGAVVYADGKKFSFIKDKNKTWNVISLTVSEAPVNEYNLNGRMTLEEINGVAHIVYNGAWNTKNGDAEAIKAAIEATYFDIQQYQNGWTVTKPTPIIEINDDGSLKVALSLEGLTPTGSTNPYYMHRGASNANVTLPNDMHFSLTVGNYRYHTQKGCSLESWMSSLTLIYIFEIETPAD